MVSIITGPAPLRDLLHCGHRRRRILQTCRGLSPPAFCYLNAGDLPDPKGFSDADARRALVTSPTTVGGLIKHLRWAEYGWFEQLLQERSDDNRRAHERSWEFEFLPEESLPTLLAEYQSQCEESRRIAARYPLGHEVPHHRFGTVSLRWIYVHMIEETARHTGQLDILREQLDGATGFDG